MNRPYALLGGGGHAGVLLDILLDSGGEVAGVISPDPISSRKVFGGIARFASDDEFKAAFDSAEVLVVNGIGPTPKGTLRQRIQSIYEELGFEFAEVISPAAVISKFAHVDSSVQIMAGAALQSGVVLGKASVINTRAVLDHDCQLGRYVHVASSATLCGGVVVADNAYIGANATIFPGVHIGRDAIVGAGAVVKTNVESGRVIYPPRSITRVKR